MAKRPKRVGVIAEDKSDVRVIETLMRKMAKRPFTVAHFVGNGCGKIVGKCNAWAANLRERGCNYLVLIHDLDSAQLSVLKGRIEAALGNWLTASTVIVIPVREIEAWLLADHVAITTAMNLKNPLNKVDNPEAIQRPKERLGELIYTKSEHARRYINSVDNEKIAAACSPTNLERCSSFQPFRAFVTDNI